MILILLLVFVGIVSSLILPRIGNKFFQHTRSSHSFVKPLYNTAGGNKRSYSPYIPQKGPSNKNVDKRGFQTSSGSSTAVRNLGPQKRSRKPLVPVDETLTGRVAVYCVGGALDLQALRSHVFRRGFGNNGARSDTSSSGMECHIFPSHVIPVDDTDNTLSTNTPTNNIPYQQDQVELKMGTMLQETELN